MRKRVYSILNKIYGALLMGSFFAGLLPLVVFIAALIIGGDTGEAISVFLYKEYYPWVIACAAISVFIGWIALYVNPDKKAAAKNKK